MVELYVCAVQLLTTVHYFWSMIFWFFSLIILLSFSYYCHSSISFVHLRFLFFYFYPYLDICQGFTQMPYFSFSLFPFFLVSYLIVVLEKSITPLCWKSYFSPDKIRNSEKYKKLLKSTKQAAILHFFLMFKKTSLPWYYSHDFVPVSCVWFPEFKKMFKNFENFFPPPP